MRIRTADHRLPLRLLPEYRSRCLPFYLPATRLGALAGAAPRLPRWSATTQPSAFTAAQAAPPAQPLASPPARERGGDA